MACTAQFASRTAGIEAVLDGGCTSTAFNSLNGLQDVTDGTHLGACQTAVAGDLNVPTHAATLDAHALDSKNERV